MSENIRYKAFISYRHTDLDKKVAEKLQRKLESYKPPKGIRQDAAWKIFRDETELSTHSNLSEGILQALGKSEYLILICSESTKHSKWCLQEITHFKKLHNGSTDNIITLVTSGNPEEIFPDEILTTAVYDSQTGEMKEKSVEPLAANISSDTERGALKALDTEFLRIAAPLLRCSYDDLFLRDRRRRRRRITASVSAALALAVMFSVYSVLTMMKISSQNADLEKKNQQLDSSNSSLRMAYNNLDNANLELERTNASLDLTNLTLKEKNDELDNANTRLTDANKKLDEANTELTDTNKKLDNANTELTDANKKLDDANTELTDANKKLDDANTELTNTNKELDDANTEISNANKELDKKNAELTSTNKELDTAYTEISKTNQELEQKTKEAQENYEEAERLRQEAQKNYEEAEKQRQIAQENYEEAEKQRLIAQENLEKLRIANAEVVAAKADADLSNNYDRVSAVEEVLSARPYEDDESKLLPSATRFLNKALYSFTMVMEPRLDITLDAESTIADFSFSPDRSHIVAYDLLNYVYVFDTMDGDLLYQELVGSSLYGASFADDSHIIIVEANRVRSIDITDGSVVWEHTKQSLGKIIEGVCFSSDGARAAVWVQNMLYAIDTQSGEIFSSIKVPNGCNIFTANDYADGVHFVAELKNGKYSFLAEFNTDTAGVNVFSYMSTDKVILRIKYVPGTGCGVLYKESGEDGYTIYKQFDENGNSQFALPIYMTTITDSEIKKPFTVEDTGETYVPITGIDAADERPAVYFICTDTQEIKSLHMPASVKQVGYRGTDGTNDGWVSVYTSSGRQYNYNLYVDESYMGHITIDTEMGNADGSAKLVWVEGNTVAALGETSNKIMVYHSMYDKSFIAAKHEGETIMRVMNVTKNYVVGENSNTFYIYDKFDKSPVKTIQAGYFVVDYGVYHDQLVSIDRDTGRLWFYDLHSDDASYIDMCQYSQYGNTFWDILINEEEDTLAAISLSDIVTIKDTSINHRSFNRIFSVGLKTPIALSPDGSRLILQSQDSKGDMRYYLDVFDTGDLSIHNLITQDDVIYNISYNYNITNFVISEDSQKAAVVHDRDIRIYDLQNLQLISEISLGVRTPYAQLFEPGADKLLIVTGDYMLFEYDVSSGEMLNSTKLPSRINPANYSIKNQIEFNHKANELVLSNDTYACFVSLDYFSVSAETNDEYTLYRGFIDDTQELIFQSDGELLFYPYYTPAELIEKAEQLIESKKQ